MWMAFVARNVFVSAVSKTVVLFAISLTTMPSTTDWVAYSVGKHHVLHCENANPSYGMTDDEIVEAEAVEDFQEFTPDRVWKDEFF
jgi:hypothetical protein